MIWKKIFLLIIQCMWCKNKSVCLQFQHWKFICWNLHWRFTWKEDDHDSIDSFRMRRWINYSKTWIRSIVFGAISDKNECYSPCHVNSKYFPSVLFFFAQLLIKFSFCDVGISGQATPCKTRIKVKDQDTQKSLYAIARNLSFYANR